MTHGLTLAHTRTIALALLHFLWQGALIAFLLALANSLLARASARARCAAGCAALAVMLALPLATVWRLQAPARDVWDARVAESTMVLSPGETAAAEGSITAAAADVVTRLAPWIVFLWLSGVGLLSIRAAGGWLAAGRLSHRGTRAVPADGEVRLAKLAARLSVRRPVQLLESLRVEVPAAIGILRPVILLPAGMATGLTAEQMDALLAHELAHIRRSDFLVNLLQVVAETLLFYHPAVWWVSSRIRVERENACDDLAVEATGDAASYARALLTLEERRSGGLAPRLAVAADGGRLWSRIARLFPASNASRERTPRSLAVAVALGGVLATGIAASVLVPARAGASASQAALAPTPAPVRAAAPTPEPRPEARPSPARERAAGLLSPQQLMAFRIHGVTPEFIDEIEELGYRKVSADDLVALRIHGVSPELIRRMTALFGKLPLEDYVAFKIHGVTPEFARELRQLGLTELSADDAVAFRIHGVTPQFVKEIRGLGYASIDADELTAFRIHGVTPEYIRSMNESAGGRLSADDLIEGRVHGEGEEENP
jgi:beta-lactamase regulating signal transducer with metallopeptidase domain